MDFFFNPNGIAIVGATTNPLKGGFAIVKNVASGYKGKVYPVNPLYQEIEGFKCYPSVSAIPDPVDLAIVFIPAKQVPEIIEECAKKGIRGVMIQSGGFAEAGPEGKSFQQSIKDTATRTGIRIWGPNCMGLIDAVNGYIFSFTDPTSGQEGLLRGTVSLIVQSGMLSAGFLVDITTHGITGVSKVCSVGNKADVNECDVLDYLLRDPATEVVGMYLESFSDGRAFMELCRQSTKPIVLLAGGRSVKGAEAAMSHTASLSANHRIASGILAQVGVTEAKDFMQLIDICRSFASVPSGSVNRRGSVAILTFSGGAGIVTSDFTEDFGLPVAELSDDTKAFLAKLYPEWMPVCNPVDIWPAIERHIGADVDVYKSALEAVLADPNVDAVLMLAYAGNIRLKIDIPDVARQRRASGKPVFIWLLGSRERTFHFKKEAMSHGIPVFDEIQRTVECMSAVVHQGHHDKMESNPLMPEKYFSLSAQLSKIMQTAEGPLDEYTSKAILAAYQIPTTVEEIAKDAAQCEALARKIGFPVVMKGLQSGQVHKTELGLVHLNVTSSEIALQVFDSLTKKMGPSGQVLVSKQVDGNIEIIAGMLRDSQFGPCVMIGVGGTMAEIIEDVVFALAPLTQKEALELISRIKSQKLLNGFRGNPPVDREDLARILVHLGNLGMIYPRIHEVDINPMIITKHGAVAVDATIILR